MFWVGWELHKEQPNVITVGVVLAFMLCRLASPFPEVELLMSVPAQAHDLPTGLWAGCLRHPLLGPRRLGRIHCPIWLPCSTTGSSKQITSDTRESWSQSHQQWGVGVLVTRKAKVEEEPLRSEENHCEIQPEV